MKNYVLGFITTILLAYSSYMLVTPTHAASEPIITFIDKTFGSGMTTYNVHYTKLQDGNVVCYTVGGQSNISCVVINR